VVSQKIELNESFYNTEEKRTRLGLTIGHKIIKEHGGRMNIECDANFSTSIEIILPIKH